MKQAGEWRTLALLVICYSLWLFITSVAAFPAWITLPVLTLTLVLHSSLQHELLHGHPFKNNLLNEIAGSASLSFTFPFRRFRTLHLHHHIPELITDPENDPESNYLTPSDWQQRPLWQRRIFVFNNTLFGRLLVGPVLAIPRFWRSELGKILNGDREIIKDWILYVLAAIPVLLWLLAFGKTGFVVYFVSAYLATGILQIRTFLEHQADETPTARSVIIEDRGLLAFLFLNNNFHAVHHANQDMPWYQIPAEYEAKRAHYLKANHGYRYNSYREVFARYFFKAKDPVAHPLMAE